MAIVNRHKTRHQKRHGAPCKNCGGTERYGGSHSCIACQNKRGRERRATGLRTTEERNYRFRHHYGLNIDEVNKILAKQNNQCAICNKTTPGHKTGWRLDHDHMTKKIRGVLCHACNLGIGWFRDSEENLLKAVEYLRSAI